MLGLPYGFISIKGLTPLAFFFGFFPGGYFLSKILSLVTDNLVAVSLRRADCVVTCPWRSSRQQILHRLVGCDKDSVYTHFFFFLIPCDVTFTSACILQLLWSRYALPCRGAERPLNLICNQVVSLRVAKGKL